MAGGGRAGGGGRPKVEKREMMLKDAVPVLTEIESEKLISDDEIKRLALWSVEQEGIVFIDEIDKICSRSDFRGSADASSEGVQRDLLPLLEGSNVSTKQATTRRTASSGRRMGHRIGRRKGHRRGHKRAIRAI